MPDEKPDANKGSILSVDIGPFVNWFEKYPGALIGVLALAAIGGPLYEAVLQKVPWGMGDTISVAAGGVLLVVALYLQRQASKRPEEQREVAVKAYLVLITFMVAGAIASAWVPAFRVSHIHDVEDAILLAMLITSWAGLIPVYWSRTALAGVPRQMRALARLLAERDESIKADLETAKKEIAEEFKKSQNQLVDTVTAAKEQLVNTVEDATRSKLEGFPEVFKKAFEMIQQAQDKLYLINFAMNFGAPHLCNSEFRETYSKKFRGRDLEADVSKFFETLQIKVAQISDVQILTVNNEGCLTNFLEPLSQRDGYRNSMNVAEQRRNAEEAKTEIRKWLNLRSSGKTFVEATSLPIQLLITGLPPDAKHPNGGVGCLVFMVGTEVLKSDLEPGEEPAFYTELESMSSMFSKLALALIQSAKRDQGEQAYESRRIGA